MSCAAARGRSEVLPSGLQREGRTRAATQEPLGEQPGQGPVGLVGILRPGGQDLRLGDWPWGVTNGAEQDAAALPVGARVGLPAPRRAVVRWAAGGLPRARCPHGTARAGGAAGGAHEGTQFHLGRRPRRSPPGLLGDPLPGAPPFGAGEVISGELLTGFHAR